MISSPLLTLILTILTIDLAKPNILLRNISVTPHPQVRID